MGDKVDKLPEVLAGLAPNQVAAAQQPFVPYSDALDADPASKHTSRHTGFTRAQHEAAAKLKPVKIVKDAQHVRKCLTPDEGKVAPGATPRPNTMGKPHAWTPDYRKQVDTDALDCTICGFGKELHELAKAETTDDGYKWDPKSKTWG